MTLYIKPKEFLPSLFMTICVIIWFFPTGLRHQYPALTWYINASQCLLWGMLFAYTLPRRIRVSGFCRALNLFWMIFLGCILISDARSVTINTWLTVFCSISGIMLIAELWGYEHITRVFYRVFTVLAVLNCVLLFLRPEGYRYVRTASDGLSTSVTSSNFLTTDNLYVPFVLCLLMLNELCLLRGAAKRTSYFFVWTVVLISVVRIFSATCVIGVIIFMMGRFLLNVRIRKFRLKVIHVVTAAALIFIGIYFFQIQKLLAPLIVTLLGKDLTLTGRIGLWEMALELIREKPLFGWGNYRQGAILLRQYYYWYAHNLFLDILLEGGLVCMGAFLYMLSAYAKAIRIMLNDRVVRICLLTFVVFMIVNIAESFLNNPYFYIPMIVSAVYTRKPNSEPKGSAEGFIRLERKEALWKK